MHEKEDPADSLRLNESAAGCIYMTNKGMYCFLLAACGTFLADSNVSMAIASLATARALDIVNQARFSPQNPNDLKH